MGAELTCANTTDAAAVRASIATLRQKHVPQNGQKTLDCHALTKNILLYLKPLGLIQTPQNLCGGQHKKYRSAGQQRLRTDTGAASLISGTLVMKRA
ncbi:hypothetical protein [Desulfovibrio sp. QI0434]